MHIVVCIKQVPDSAQIRVHPVTNTIMRQGVPAIVNPYDLFSLEAALRLKDEHGGRVTVISMGPPQAEGALKKCIAFGADAAILVTDRAFAGADTLATSFALASAIQQIEKDMKVDMVFAGKQTIDGDTAQVGPGIAKRLNMQLLTYVSQIDALDMDKREIQVQRRAEGGVQVLQTKLPCLVNIWNKDAAGIEDISKIGLKGSPTLVSKVFAPQPNTKPAELIDTESHEPRDIALTLVSKLFTQHPKLRDSIVKQAA